MCWPASAAHLSSGSCPEDILPAGRRGLHGTTQIVLKPSWKVTCCLKEYSTYQVSAIDRPGGDPGPGPMLSLWRDFAGCFDVLPPGFKTTVLLALFTSPVTIPTAAVVSSWKLSKHTDTLVTKTYLDTKLDDLETKLDKKLDKKLLPFYILGSYVNIVITGLAFASAPR